jgi:nitroreductase/NAD-dependent dihydropyrimidine dehydrogenase PreA subunit
VLIDRAKCTKCLQCASVCPGQPLYVEAGEVQVDQSRWFGCIACGHCMAVCPEGAIAITGRDLTPADVHDLPALGDRASYPQLLNLVRARRSVRRFQKREVPREIVQKVLDAAVNAPMGVPPSDVGVVVVNGFDKMRAFTADIQAAFKKMQFIFSPAMTVMMRPFVGKQGYTMMRHFVGPLLKKYEEEHGKGHDLLLYDAPLALYFYATAGADPADAVIACTYAQMAADALGLGTCFIGMPGFAFKQNAVLREKYGIPSEIHPGLVLIAGYTTTAWKQSLHRRFARVEWA